MQQIDDGQNLCTEDTQQIDDVQNICTEDTEDTEDAWRAYGSLACIDMQDK